MGNLTAFIKSKSSQAEIFLIFVHLDFSIKLNKILSITALDTRKVLLLGTKTLSRGL